MADKNPTRAGCRAAEMEVWETNNDETLLSCDCGYEIEVAYKVNPVTLFLAACEHTGEDPAEVLKEASRG